MEYQIDMPDYKNGKTTKNLSNFGKSNMFETEFSKFDVMINKSQISNSYFSPDFVAEPNERKKQTNDIHISGISGNDRKYSTISEVIPHDNFISKINEQLRQDAEFIPMNDGLSVAKKQSDTPKRKTVNISKEIEMNSKRSVFKSDNLINLRVNDFAKNFMSFKAKPTDPGMMSLNEGSEREQDNSYQPPAKKNKVVDIRENKSLFDENSNKSRKFLNF